jgi:hypothetical protein
MPATAPTILATSMGFASRGRGPYDWTPGPVFDLAVELAGRPERPRLCYLGTATGDDPARISGVYGALRQRGAGQPPEPVPDADRARPPRAPAGAGPGRGL